MLASVNLLAVCCVLFVPAAHAGFLGGSDAKTSAASTQASLEVDRLPQGARSQMTEAPAPPSTLTAAVRGLAAALANASRGTPGVAALSSVPADARRLMGPAKCSLALSVEAGNTGRVEYDQLPKPLICTKDCFASFNVDWGDPLTTDLRLDQKNTLHDCDTLAFQMKAEGSTPSGSATFKHAYTCKVCGEPCDVRFGKMPAPMRQALGAAPPPLEMPPCPIKPGEHIFAMGDIMMPAPFPQMDGVKGMVHFKQSILKGKTVVASQVLNLSWP